MTVVGNFYFFIFLRLAWEFLGLESECGGSVCWPNNKIIDSWVLAIKACMDTNVLLDRRMHNFRPPAATNQGSIQFSI